MKTRMFLFATTFLMMAAGVGFVSCTQSNGVMNTDDSQQTAAKAKAHVKLSISPTLSVSSSTMQSRKASLPSPRAALTAEGKALTGLLHFRLRQADGHAAAGTPPDERCRGLRRAGSDPRLRRAHPESDCHQKHLPYPAGCRGR